MKKSDLKVMTVVGTRPEVIRLSSVIKRFDKYLNHKLVHTGQNYDYELSEVFFEDLDLREPDVLMNASKDSLGSTVGDIIKESEKILKEVAPDALLILGDTNSSLSGYMAKRLHIPIYHMEAGNRCFDLNVPEETNRKIIDHIADFNLVYTERSRQHLLSEGLPHRRIYSTGSPMKEVLSDNMEKIKNSEILDELGLQEGNYFLVSAHREENVDKEDNLNKILGLLNRLVKGYDLPVIVSTHPRTQKRLSEVNDVPVLSKVRFLKPFSFSDYNKLQLKAKCVISDSGTISEESAILGFPAVTVRNSMERPEAMDAGSIILTGLNPEIVLDSINVVTSDFEKDQKQSIPKEYEIKNTSQRVLRLVLGTAKLSNKWAGVQKNN